MTFRRIMPPTLATDDGTVLRMPGQSTAAGRGGKLLVWDDTLNGGDGGLAWGDITNNSVGNPAGSLLTGKGGRTSAWTPAPVQQASGSVGSVATALSAVLATLNTLGIDTSKVKQWQRGYAGVNAITPVPANQGWFAYYSSDGVYAASTGLPGGTAYPAALNAIHDPLARGVSGTLFYCTGAGAQPWPTTAQFWPQWWDTSTLTLSHGTGGVDSTDVVNRGQRLNYGAWFSFPNKVAYGGHIVSDAAGTTLLDWDYQA